MQAARRGYRASFASAQNWVGRLGQARRCGWLEDELKRLRRVPLLIDDLCLPGNYADVVVAG